MERNITNDKALSRRSCFAAGFAAITAWSAVGTSLGQEIGRREVSVSRPLGDQSVRISKTGKRQITPSRVFRLTPVDVDVKQVVVTAMAVDPQGEYLAVAGDDHVIRLLDTANMRVCHTLGRGVKQSTDSNLGHFDWIRTLAFDADGSRLASTGNDGQLIIWDRRRDFEVLQRIGSAPALACVSFSPAGNQMAAVGFDSQVFLIGKDSAQTPNIQCGCVDLRCCRYNDDGSLLIVGGRDGRLHGFDPRSGKSRFEKQLHDGRIRDIAFMPETGLLVSAGEDGQMCCFDCQKQQIISRERISSGRLFSIAVLSSTQIAAAGSDDQIHLVEMLGDQSGLQQSARLIGHVGSISRLVMVDGELISGGFDATVRRWNLQKQSLPPNKIARGQSGKDAATSEAR